MRAQKKRLHEDGRLRAYGCRDANPALCFLQRYSDIAPVQGARQALGKQELMGDGQ